ncbi:twin-arginine translocase TatA/TatE family subunit [Fluviicola taffensis]|uniref:Sec-independent translocation protein mttA/Hcf106 n=1 Tax=Fluviicola taffensis (strain DSM 16823 / NCIMB 13979 / RW262) TaxID=755732 RepID=F2IE43_FLUTR|nr:twin-arginine translocase TatA/TatE family subunit [Fluviicola taffensis]AEA45607.1 sec-independent translocation protein mttA/Hcf106 [Fluviicola taffensis DSM 16823]
MTVLPLFLSDIGGSEIVLILLVILMFFGSKSIPGIARSMGKTMHQIKQASQDVQNEIKKSTGDLKGDFNLQNVMRDTMDVIEKPFNEEARKMDQIIQTPTEFSRPFGVPNPASTPVISEPSEVAETVVSLDQQVSEVSVKSETDEK